jgi:hypothetical protein
VQVIGRRLPRDYKSVNGVIDEWDKDDANLYKENVGDGLQISVGVVEILGPVSAFELV